MTKTGPTSPSLKKWEARYQRADLELGAPSSFLATRLSGLDPRGPALDVAGGLGRHTLLLAGSGWSTRLVDFSPSALHRAAAAARESGLTIETEARDLELVGLPEGLFGLILVSWYLLPEIAWSQLSDRLLPGGHFLYVQPTWTNLERNAHPSQRFLVAPGELETRARNLGLEVVHFEEGWADEGGAHLAHLHAVHPPDA